MRMLKGRKVIPKQKSQHAENPASSKFRAFQFISIRCNDILLNKIGLAIFITKQINHFFVFSDYYDWCKSLIVMCI